MRARYGWLSIIAAVLLAISSAHAQYPAKPVRLIVPFPPAAGTDTLARIYGQKLGDLLGQQVLIDNRPGGGTNIGAEIAAKSPPDGYTALMGNIAHAINVTLYSKLAYDFVKDFAPVTLLASTPNILVVHPSLPVRSVKELIALAKARPGQLDYASSGSGSSSHLAAELFSSMAGVKMTHIPYKGGGPAVVALAGGQVSVGFATTPSVIGHIKSGKMRGLAVTTAQRSPSTPELPTMSEAGRRGLRGRNVVRASRAGGHSEGDRDAPARGIGEAPEASGCEGTARRGRLRADRQHARAVRRVHPQRNR